jgi:MFS family permease
MTEITGKSYKALFVIIMLNLLIGVQYCWSVISPRWADLFGLTPTLATIPYMVLTVSNSIAAIPLARWGEKYGPNKVIFLGGLGVGAGILICSVSESLMGMILGYGLVASFGLAAISFNSTATAIKWFPANKKGLITGVSSMCIGLSSLYMAPLIEGLLNILGLNKGLGILGIASGALVCLFALMLPILQLESKTEGAATPVEDNSRYHGTITPSQIIRTREFWLLLTMYSMNWMPGQIIFSSVSTICQVQANWDKGYVALMAMAVGNGAGRLLTSALSDKLGGIKTMKVILTVQAINLSIFVFCRTPVSISLGLVIMGFCAGAGVSLMMILAANIYGIKYVSSAYAWLSWGYAIAGIVGPLLAAILLEQSGSYAVAYYVNVVFLLIGLYCAFAIKSKKAGQTHQNEPNVGIT